MPSTIQVGKRIFTTEEICEQLSNSELLPQLLREMIIDEILADWEIDLDGKIPYNQDEFAEGCDRLGKLAGYQGLNQLQLYKIVDRHLRLRKFKHARWNSRIYSYYLQQKSRFDRLEFSLIGVTDPGLAEEIFFRVQSGEQSLKDLAFKYSECGTARDGGKISVSNIDQIDPQIAAYIVNLKSGEISPIFRLENLYVFVRLEGYISAALDDELNNTLIDELFETWVQQKISERLGLFELENSEDMPQLTAEDLTQMTESEVLELIDHMDTIDRQPEISDLIEPTSSFFFPKELPTSHHRFEDPAHVGVSSSFFFPKDSPTQLIYKSNQSGSFQRIVSFLLFFSIFLGIKIAILKMFNRLEIPQLNVGSSRIL